MKEKTEAKFQQVLQDLNAELSQLQQIEPLKQEICNLQVAVLTAEFECPVYFEIMGPPKEVFQCPIGHFICGDCNLQGSFMTYFMSAGLHLVDWETSPGTGPWSKSSEPTRK